PGAWRWRRCPDTGAARRAPSASCSSRSPATITPRPRWTRARSTCGCRRARRGPRTTRCRRPACASATSRSRPERRRSRARRGAADIPGGVRLQPADALRAARQTGAHEIALAEAPVTGGDPHLFLFPLSTSEGARPGALARNFSFYRNPRLDDVLIRASQLSSRVERARLYQRAQALLADDMPWIPIYVRLVWAVTRPEVRNLRLHPTGLHRLNTVTLEPG